MVLKAGWRIVRYPVFLWLGGFINYVKNINLFYIKTFYTHKTKLKLTNLSLKKVRSITFVITTPKYPPHLSKICNKKSFILQSF
jgi:hypothetical protein